MDWTWDLSYLYKGFDDEAFTADLARVPQLLEEKKALLTADMSDLSRLEALTDMNETLFALLDKLFTFVGLTLAVDAENDYIYGVSIPRDTKASINGKNRKINFAYNSGGMELMAQTVSHQLGIPVDYTVLVDLRAFQALVDAIGGVDFYIPVNMDYDDPYQNLSIHFSKGMRHLNGAEALKVVRFRHNNDGSGYGSEDIGRMQTQQDFLKAVAKQTLTVSNLTKLDSFCKIFQQYVETDLTVGNLVWLGGEAIGMGAENIEFSTLPGDWKSPYIYLNQEEVLALVNQYLNPYTEDRVPEDLNILS